MKIAKVGLIGQKLQDNVLEVAGKILSGRSEFIKKDVKPAFEDIIEQKAIGIGATLTGRL